MKSPFLLLFALSATSFFISSFASADEPSLFEKSLQAASMNTVDTKESIVEHNGVKYRRVESSMGVYYFKFLGRDENLTELECQTDFGKEKPALISTSVQVFHRTQAFIRGLKENCETHNGQQKMSVDWSLRSLEVGVALPDSRDSVIKKKEIYTNPLGGPNLGFSGQF